MPARSRIRSLPGNAAAAALTAANALDAVNVSTLALAGTAAPTVLSHSASGTAPKMQTRSGAEWEISTMFWS